MSRSDTLFRQLDRLDAEYCRRLISELEKTANGFHSTYFSRKRSFVFTSRHWKKNEVAEIENTERDLRKLCDKLNIDSSTTSLRFLSRYLEETNSIDKRIKGSETHKARIVLQELKNTEQRAPANYSGGTPS
jgi:hypothetical protein